LGWGDDGEDAARAPEGPRGVKMVAARDSDTRQPVQQEAGARRGTSSRWVSFILLGAGLAILIAFAATTNLRQVGEALRSIDVSLLAVAVAALVTQIYLKGLRWRFMVRRLTGRTISRRFGAISIVAGVAAGSIAPGRSFELAKAVMLKGSYEIPLGVSTSAMIVERMLDMGVIVLTFLLAAAFVPSGVVLASRVLMLTIAALVVTFGAVLGAPQLVQAWAAAAARRLPLPVALRDRGARVIETFFSSLRLLRAQRTLVFLLVLTTVIAALDIARVVTVFGAMGIHLALSLVAFAYIGAAMLGMMLLVPGGVGVTEVSMAGLIALLSPGAVAPALARSAVLVDRFLSYYVIVLIGAGLLVAYHRFRHLFE